MARSWETKIKSRRAPLDLVEVRRQLTAMRSLHSNDRRVTRLINKTLVKLAHLHEPAGRVHEKRLHELIAKTVHMVETMTSPDPCPFVGAAISGQSREKPT
jgi:hypothetical protein